MSTVAFGLLVLAVAPVPEVGADAELKRFAGTWVVERVEFDGMTVGEDVLKDFRLTFDGDRCSAAMGQVVLNATLVVKPTDPFPHLDVTMADGPNKGELTRNIYRFRDGQLHICAGRPGVARPTGFETKGQPGVVLVVLKPAK